MLSRFVATLRYLIVVLTFLTLTSGNAQAGTAVGVSGSQTFGGTSTDLNWAIKGLGERWFSFTPTTNGPLSITEFNVSSYLLLAVYDCSSGNGPYAYGCNLVGKSKALNAQVTFEAKAGIKYYIQIVFSASPPSVVAAPTTYSWDITATRYGTGIRFQFTGEAINPDSSYIYYNQSQIALASGTSYIIEPASSGVYAIGVVAQGGKISFMKWLNVP